MATIDLWRYYLYPHYDWEWKVGTTPLSDFSVILNTWVIYFSTITILWLYMKNRNSHEVRGITALHNAFLCILSTVMCAGISWEIYLLWDNKGWSGVYCPQNQPKGRLYYWIYIYYLSKFPELLDTVIIVLKKKPLLFLHVYHHAVVFILPWLWMTETLGFASFGMMFNTFVHIFMYYFFTATSLGVRIWWKKYITTIQIVQFVCSFAMSVPYLYFMVERGPDGGLTLDTSNCPGWMAWVISATINGSFLVLFINFYRTTYDLRTSDPQKVIKHE